MKFTVSADFGKESTVLVGTKRFKIPDVQPQKIKK
jgi:hypothetical protein